MRTMYASTRRSATLVAFQPAVARWVQGVSSTGRAELLDDVLEAAAGDLGHTVCVSAQNQGGIDVAASSALAGEHLGLAGFHEADALDAANLAS